MGKKQTKEFVVNSKESEENIKLNTPSEMYSKLLQVGMRHGVVKLLKDQFQYASLDMFRLKTSEHFSFTGIFSCNQLFPRKIFDQALLKMQQSDAMVSTIFVLQTTTSSILGAKVIKSDSTYSFHTTNAHIIRFNFLQAHCTFAHSPLTFTRCFGFSLPHEYLKFVTGVKKVTMLLFLTSRGNYVDLEAEYWTSTKQIIIVTLKFKSKNFPYACEIKIKDSQRTEYAVGHLITSLHTTKGGRFKDVTIVF